MPGRFKQTGTHYVSQWGGSSLNNGTNPDTPYANLADVPVVTNQVIVIGSGYYKLGSGSQRAGARIIADGFVVLDCQNIVQNSLGVLEIVGCVILNLPTGSVFTLSGTLTNCVTKNCTGGSGNSVPSLLGSVLLNNGGIPSAFQAFTNFNNSIFLETLNGPAQSHPVFQGNYVAKNATIQFIGSAAMTTQFTNNCFNGIISRGGVNYELKRLFDGSTRPDANPSILDLVTISPNCYANGNFATLDPKFLDVERRLVAPDSDLLKRSFNGRFIGDVKPAQIIRLDNTNFQFTYTRINTSNPLSVAVAAGQTDGEIRITGKVSDNLISSSIFAFRGVYEFWNGAAGGTSQNNNVMDAVKTLGLLASQIDKPRRLTYLLRTSQDPTANQSSSDAIWDNDGAGAGQWLLMEINTIPTHVSNLGVIYGNGDPRGGGQVGTPFNFRSIDVRVMLDNDRD